MNKKYITYRPTYLNDTSLYTPSFFNDLQFADYIKAGLTKIKDCIVNENSYTAELIPGIKSLRRFGVLEYNQDYVNGDDFATNVKTIGVNFAIELLTPTEAIERLKNNTNLEWKSENEVILCNEYEDTITLTTIPQQTLIVD